MNPMLQLLMEAHELRIKDLSEGLNLRIEALKDQRTQLIASLLLESQKRQGLIAEHATSKGMLEGQVKELEAQLAVQKQEIAQQRAMNEQKDVELAELHTKFFLLQQKNTELSDTVFEEQKKFKELEEVRPTRRVTIIITFPKM